MKVPEIPSLQEIMIRMREIQNQINSLSAPKPKDISPAKPTPQESIHPPLEDRNPKDSFYDYLKEPSTKSQSLYEKIQEESIKKGLDPNLVGALIKVESNFQPKAISPKGALGIMQLMPATAKMLGVEDPMDPMENIEGGTSYLRDLLKMFGDRRLALAAYNAGPNAVKNYGGVPPYRETIQFIEKVERYLKKPETIFGSRYNQLV